MTILCESRSKVLSSSAVMSAISQFNDSCSAGVLKSSKVDSLCVADARNQIVGILNHPVRPIPT